MNYSPTILLVDDDADDVLLFRYALGACSLPAELRVVRDGHDAVKYLSGYGVFGKRDQFPLPGIVILDLHMPRYDGYSVLRWIRRQPSMTGLPVVVFTGTKEGAAKALEQGADIYLRKGADTGELLALLQQVNLDWQQKSDFSRAFPSGIRTAEDHSDSFQGFQFAS